MSEGVETDFYQEAKDGMHENVFRHHSPIPNANLRYKKVLEANAREQMSLFSPTHNNSAQRVGRLYGAGMNHPLIEEGVEREQLIEQTGVKGSPLNNQKSDIFATGKHPERRGQHRDRGGLHKTTVSLLHSETQKHQSPDIIHTKHTFSAYPSHDGSAGGVDKKYPQPMKTSVALGLLDKQSGGKYHVPSHVHEPYAEPLVGQPQGSLFTKTTPLMWDMQKTKEIDNVACTKSGLFQRSAMMESMDDSNSSKSHLPSSFIEGDLGSKQYNQHAVRSSRQSEYESNMDLVEKSMSLPLYDPNASSFETSALQQTLVDCGKLKKADSHYAKDMSQEVFKSLKSDISNAKKHAMWLKHKKNASSDSQFYDESFMSGLDDNAGSFFTRDEMDQQNSDYGLNSPPRTIVRSRGNILRREKAAIKTLRQRAHSNSSGDLSKYKKGGGMAPRGFRGNSSVMKVKGSKLEDATHSRILQSASRYDNSQDSKVSALRNRMADRSRVEKDKERAKRSHPKNYSEEMAKHLDVTLVANSNNPHRAQSRGDSDVKFGSHLSLQVLRQKDIDPKIYSKSHMNSRYGSYNVTVKDPIVRDLPSQEYISNAMTQISKQMLISYSTRIVETGAALRALQSTKHEKPGIAAILELNRAMIAAASFNPSCWDVSRAQFEHVMHEQVPWLDKAVVSRLASAYDPQKSGVIKFARLSAALMAGNRPAMSILMSNISRDPDKVDDSGNVFLLRLLHSIYEDCDGGVVEEIASTLERDPVKCMRMAKPNSNTGLGIKLEDVPEILSVCASSVEDETLMKEISMEVVQVLYDYGKAHDENFTDLDEKYRSIRSANDNYFSSQEIYSATDGASMISNSRASTTSNSTMSEMLKNKDGRDNTLKDKDRLFASTVLKFDMLKSISDIGRVSQNAFIKCVSRHPVVIKEFRRQIERFRELLTPYQVNGSITYEESLSQNSAYGTLVPH